MKEETGDFKRDGWSMIFWLKLSSCTYDSCVKMPSRSDLNALINQLHDVYRNCNIPSMILFIYVHFVKYQHCDFMCFIQFNSLLFTWSMCLVNKQYCLIIVCLLKYVFFALIQSSRGRNANEGKQNDEIQICAAFSKSNNRTCLQETLGGVHTCIHTFLIIIRLKIYTQLIVKPATC